MPHEIKVNGYKPSKWPSRPEMNVDAHQESSLLKYDKQMLLPEQQYQVRQNIGAYPGKDLYFYRTGEGAKHDDDICVATVGDRIFHGASYTSGSVTNKGMVFPCNVISRNDHGPVHVMILIDARGDAWEVIVVNNTINTIARLSKPPFVVDIREDYDGTFSCMALFDEIKREHERGCKVYAIVTSNSYNGIADLVNINDTSILFAAPIMFDVDESNVESDFTVSLGVVSAYRIEVHVFKSESGLTMAKARIASYYPLPTFPIEVAVKNNTGTFFMGSVVGSWTLDAAKNDYARYRPYLVFNDEPFITAELTENSITIVYMGKGEDGQYGVQKTTFGGITWKTTEEEPI